MLIIRILSAVMAFVMAVLPFGGTNGQKCKPEFNGTFLQSWMSSSWDSERWEKEVKNMQDAGIEYLIIQDVANKGYKSEGGQWSVYYESELACFEDAAFGSDVVKASLEACKDSGIKVFIGLGMFDDFWTESAISSQYAEVCDIMAQMVNEIYEKYAAQYGDTLYGWYFTPEISNGILCQLSIGGIAKGVNTVIESINATDETKPLLLSPFFTEYLSTGSAVSLSNYVRFFDAVNFRDGDIFAPQDAVGAKWVSEKNLERNWKMYEIAVDSCKAEVKLWANCENFSIAVADTLTDGITGPTATENTVYVTETLDRFVRQMEIASGYAENIITFSYNHYYSPDYVNEGFINTYYDYIENGYVLETEAPSQPAEFKAEKSEDGTVLTWQAAEDNIGIAYYRIEKDGKFFARTDMVYGWEELKVTDSGAAGVYSIVAVDCAGNQSEKVFAE